MPSACPLTIRFSGQPDTTVVSNDRQRGQRAVKRKPPRLIPGAAFTCPLDQLAPISGSDHCSELISRAPKAPRNPHSQDLTLQVKAVVEALILAAVAVQALVDEALLVQGLFGALIVP
jgi:hypothetical protein